MNNSICDDLDNKHDKGVKFAIENKANTVLFRPFLGYEIYQWSYFNAPRTQSSNTDFYEIEHNRFNIECCSIK